MNPPMQYTALSDIISISTINYLPCLVLIPHFIPKIILNPFIFTYHPLWISYRSFLNLIILLLSFLFVITFTRIITQILLIILLVICSYCLMEPVLIPYEIVYELSINYDQSLLHIWLLFSITTTQMVRILMR